MIPQKDMLPHYTFDDYLHWEGQWELINGIPHAMSPAPAPKHQRIAANLLVELGAPLKNCGLYRVYQPIDYKVTDDTVFQPDVLVVCGKIEKLYLDFAPALVAEILSPATVLKDRHLKFPIYERQGVRYFVLISAEKEIAEIYELVDGEYDLRIKGREAKFDFNFSECTATIDFAELWK